MVIEGPTEFISFPPNLREWQKAASHGDDQMIMERKMERDALYKAADDTPSKLPTSKFAAMFGVQPDTVRRGLCVNGHYMGIVPIKTPNNRLLWPVAPALKILEG